MDKDGNSEHKDDADEGGSHDEGTPTSGGGGSSGESQTDPLRSEDTPDADPGASDGDAAVTPSAADAPSSSEDHEAEDVRARRSRRPVALAGAGILAAAALLGVGYFVGSAASDDSAQVNKLTASVSSIESERNDLQSKASSLESDNSTLESQLADTQKQLDAERNLKPGSTADTTSGSGSGPVPTDVKLGQAADIGPVTMKLVAFDRQGGSGAEVTYLARITAKNNGSEPISIFCGDDGAAMIDDQGRSFDATSVLGENTDNCGDDLQPGLTNENYVMKFNAPRDAKPAAVQLWGTYDNQDSAQVWAVS